MSTSESVPLPRAPFDAEAQIARLDGEDADTKIEILEGILDGLGRTLTTAQG